LPTLVAVATEDPDALRAAELAAEAAGIDYGAFEQEVKKIKKAKGKPAPAPVAVEEEMNKMLMSNKKRKLYERMKYGQQKKDAEVGSSTRNCGCLVAITDSDWVSERNWSKGGGSWMRGRGSGRGRVIAVSHSGIQAEFLTETMSDQPTTRLSPASPQRSRQHTGVLYEVSRPSLVFLLLTRHSGRVPAHGTLWSWRQGLAFKEPSQAPQQPPQRPPCR
jgi:hypothetical protein